MEQTLFLPGLTKNRMQITWVQELMVLSQVRLAIHAPLSLTAGQYSSMADASPVAAATSAASWISSPGIRWLHHQIFSVGSSHLQFPVSILSWPSSPGTPHSGVLWGPLMAGQ